MSHSILSCVSLADSDGLAPSREFGKAFMHVQVQIFVRLAAQAGMQFQQMFFRFLKTRFNIEFLANHGLLFQQYRNTECLQQF